jgi:hypothetical protein
VVCIGLFDRSNGARVTRDILVVLLRGTTPVSLLVGLFFDIYTFFQIGQMVPVSLVTSLVVLLRGTTPVCLLVGIFITCTHFYT